LTGLSISLSSQTPSDGSTPASPQLTIVSPADGAYVSGETMLRADLAPAGAA